MTDLVASVSLSFMAGDDLTLEFTVTDADGDALDISGMTARFAVARKVGATAVLSTETSPQTATVTLSTPASGIFQVAIAGEDTDDLAGTYRYEVELEDQSGDKATVARGPITFSPALITAESSE